MYHGGLSQAFLTRHTVLGLTISIFTRIGGGVMRTVSSSWMSALRKALVISTLDHVVSLEHARLSINRKSGASKLVVVVECSPHVAKFPQITNRLLCLYSSWTSFPCCCDCVSGLRTNTIWPFSPSVSMQQLTLDQHHRLPYSVESSQFPCRSIEAISHALHLVTMQLSWARQECSSL